MRGIHFSPQPADRQPGGARPVKGSHHSLDTDEALAAHQRMEEAISPNPDAEEATEIGPVQPGATTTGGASAQPPGSHKATSPAKHYESPEPQPEHKPPKTWGKP